jgi:hypothetical protein
VSTIQIRAIEIDMRAFYAAWGEFKQETLRRKARLSLELFLKTKKAKNSSSDFAEKLQCLASWANSKDEIFVIDERYPSVVKLRSLSFPAQEQMTRTVSGRLTPQACLTNPAFSRTGK